MFLNLEHVDVQIILGLFMSLCMRHLDCVELVVA
jgi:hypothetical protein